MIEADSLSVSIDGTTILRDVSFRVDEGESVGILGPNGSGKTTLLRCIAGLQPLSGRLTLDDVPIDRWKPRSLARRLAFLRQSTNITFDFTIEELVMLGRAPHKRMLEPYSAEDAARVDEALDRVELNHLRRRSALTLSGGELQRAFLAQALAQESPLLLLDEPTAHLDIHHRFEFMELVRELARSGRTLITVFHDLELAARFADRLIVLNAGHVDAVGTPAEVLTEETIARVFRIGSRVRTDDAGIINITYTNRLHPLTTGNVSL